MLAAALRPVSSWITGTALFLLAIAVVQALTNGWNRRRGLTVALLVLLGLIVTGGEGIESVPLWFLEGTLTGLVLLGIWIAALRHHPALVPLVTAGGAAIAGIRAAILGSYPGATAGSVIGTVVVIGLAIFWFDRLGADSAFESKRRPQAEGGGEETQLEA
jgi:hypothetical protein